MNLSPETKVHSINLYLEKNYLCASLCQKACVFHFGCTVSTMRLEQVINWFFQISANGNEQETEKPAAVLNSETLVAMSSYL